MDFGQSKNIRGKLLNSQHQEPSVDETNVHSTMRASGSNEPLSASHQYNLRKDREEALKSIGTEGFFTIIQTDPEQGYIIPEEAKKVCRLFPHLTD